MTTFEKAMKVAGWVWMIAVVLYCLWEAYLTSFMYETGDTIFGGGLLFLLAGVLPVEVIRFMWRKVNK